MTTMKRWIVEGLVRLYPASWRLEYGPELRGILLARPLGWSVIGDVICNGLRQRASAAEPFAILGLASALAILTGFAFTGGSYARDWTAVVLPSSKKIPTLTVTFLASEFYAVLLIVCGCWTQMRHGGRARQSGMAAMKMTLIAGAPIMFGALLLMSGLLSMSFGPRLPAPSALALMVSPLARLPESWIWGAIGGQLGKWIVRRGRRPAAAS